MSNTKFVLLRPKLLLPSEKWNSVSLKKWMSILTSFLPLEQIEDDLFNPDYVEVDRIMDFARSTDDRGEVTHPLRHTGGIQVAHCWQERQNQGLGLVRTSHRHTLGLRLPDLLLDLWLNSAKYFGFRMKSFTLNIFSLSCVKSFTILCWSIRTSTHFAHVYHVTQHFLVKLAAHL